MKVFRGLIQNKMSLTVLYNIIERTYTYYQLGYNTKDKYHHVMSPSQTTEIHSVIKIISCCCKGLLKLLE
jgi:hypothetical protein